MIGGRARRAGLGLACAALLGACALLGQRAAGPLVPVGSRGFPPLVDELDAASLRLAVERTLPAYARAGDAATARAAERLVAIVTTTTDPEARRAAVARDFRVVRVRDPLLLTAYYEPELQGSLAPDQTFRHPIYARPPDLVDVDPSLLDACTCQTLAGRLAEGRLRPYPTRAEIEAGALAGQGLELAWAADPIALFVLHVQGSGRLRLPDGAILGLRYAATNGRPYRSIARTLVARGFLPAERTTLPDVRQALERLPAAEQAALLATNKRYTFFRIAPDGPIGSLGVELTPGRSIATDPHLVPPGALGYLVTPSVRRFVVSQDRGAAVVGAHADLFLGAGQEAEERAGRMRDRGVLYLLFPR